MLFNRFKSPIVIGFLLVGYLSFGQSRWSAQFRPSIDFPTEEFGEYDLTTGFGFEFTASYNLFSNFQVLAGWAHHTFQIHDLDYDMDESGYLLGINFIQSLKPDSPWSYNLGAGATLVHLEIENNSGDVETDSNHGLGWQLQGGLDYSLNGGWNLRPSIRFRSLSRDIELFDTTFQARLNYLSFGFAVSKTF